jgi:integrase/recombinase XerD
MIDTNESNKAIELVIPKDKRLSNRVESAKQDIRQYWDKEYINQKLSDITDHRDRILLTTLWLSGLRISEIVSLKKCNIDFKNYTMRVKWLKSRKYNERIVPIHPKLRDLLWVYTAPMNLDDRVFPVTRQRVDKIIKTCFDKQGYAHKFRHSFAVNWLRNNGDIVSLHRMLGHSKIQTTMEYLKIVPIDIGKELIKINFD